MARNQTTQKEKRGAANGYTVAGMTTPERTDAEHLTQQAHKILNMVSVRDQHEANKGKYKNAGMYFTDAELAAQIDALVSRAGRMMQRLREKARA